MATFTLHATVAAPSDIVFDVLTDHRRYADFTPVRASTLEREGQADANGVGAIRVLKILGPPIREEVTVFERPTLFSYRMLSGAPVREHSGEVQLSPEGDRTRVRYTVVTTPSIPVPDGAWAAVNKPIIGQLLKGVVKESERRARA